MYEIIKSLHSLWAYFVLFILFATVINSWYGYLAKKDFLSKDLRFPLFGLILTHLQLLIGMILYFASPYFEVAKQLGMGATMKDSTLRLYLVEHPLVMIIAVTLITIGFSKHKKKTTALEKYKTIASLYTIALLLILSRLPWSAWLA